MFAISYRREDSAGITGRIHDRLSSEFGSEKVFMDLDSIPFGVDFRVHISKALESCRALLVVIGPRWFGTVQSGGRRIDNPADYVRLEVKHALQRGIVVIPLLIDGAQMPDENALPDDLKELAYRNAMPIDSGRDFNNHILRLSNSLKSLSPETPQASPSPIVRHEGLEEERKAREKRERLAAEQQRTQQEARTMATARLAEEKRKTAKKKGKGPLIFVLALITVGAIAAWWRIYIEPSVRQRHAAYRILDDLRLLDAACDQYAIDTEKPSGFNPTFADLKNYISPKTDLYSSGADSFGDIYGPFTVDSIPQVPTNAFNALSNAVPASFWSPF